MKDGQDAIYYITADGFAAARNSPHLEVFRKLGVEVLLMYDRVDEWVAVRPDRVRRQAAAVGGERRSRSRQARGRAPRSRRRTHRKARYKDLLERIQEVLTERASAVRLTHRLTDSPACLVSDEPRDEHEPRAPAQGVGPAGAGPQAGARDQPGPSDRRASEAARRTTSLFADWSQILFDQAMLAEGGQLDDPATFVKRLNELMLTLAGGAASRIWTPGG